VAHDVSQSKLLCAGQSIGVVAIGGGVVLAVWVKPMEAVERQGNARLHKEGQGAKVLQAMEVSEHGVATQPLAPGVVSG